MAGLLRPKPPRAQRPSCSRGGSSTPTSPRGVRAWSTSRHPGAATANRPALRLDTTVMLVDGPVKRVDNMTMAWEWRKVFHSWTASWSDWPRPAPRTQDRPRRQGRAERGCPQGGPDEVMDRPKGYFPVPALKHRPGPTSTSLRDALHSASARDRGLFHRSGRRPTALRPERQLDAAARKPVVAVGPTPNCGSPTTWTRRTAMTTRMRVGATSGVVRIWAGDDWCSVRPSPTPTSSAPPLRAEASGRRDIGMYLDAPHVFVALHPQEFFIDPSFTYPSTCGGPGVRPPRSPVSGAPGELGSTTARRSTRSICVAGWCPPTSTLCGRTANEPHMVYLVATDADTGTVMTVTGIEQAQLFDDPENGTRLLCLAVDPAVARPGKGNLLVRSSHRGVCRPRAHADGPVGVARQRGRHRALRADGLYHGSRCSVSSARTPINEPSSPRRWPRRTSPCSTHMRGSSPTRRSCAASPSRCSMQRVVICGSRMAGPASSQGESLSELTNAVAMSRCDDKRVARRIVAEAGDARAPAAGPPRSPMRTMTSSRKSTTLVVKPARGEQGAGITVGVTGVGGTRPRPSSSPRALPRRATRRALCRRGLARRGDQRQGRRGCGAPPTEVIGSGQHTIRQLVEAQSRRRATATNGESTIPSTT